MSLLPEHTVVRLIVPTKGLPAGSVGTVVHVYEAGAYEVEFDGVVTFAVPALLLEAVDPPAPVPVEAP